MGLWCNQMGAGGWIAMIAFWAAALAVVIWVVGRMFPTQRTTAGRDPDPYAVLDARLASGDLDLATYRTLRAQFDQRETATTKGPR